MSKIYDMKTSFTSGELSPLLAARVDLAQYANGARELENFIVLPQGGIRNRPGTVNTSYYYQTAPVRLVPFVFNQDDACVLMFYRGIMRDVEKPDDILINPTPYTEAQLDELRWLQSGDVMYLFHPDVPVQMLTRTRTDTETVWDIAAVEFEGGPFEDVNTDETLVLKFTPAVWLSGSTSYEGYRVELADGGGVPDGFSTLSDGDLLYAEFEIKAYTVEFLTYKPGAYRDASTPEIAENGAWYVVKNVFGAFTYKTGGRWFGTIEIQRCTPDGHTKLNEDTGLYEDLPEDEWTWEDFKSYSTDSGAEENFSYSGTVEADDYPTHFRFRTVSENNRYVRWSFNYEGGVIKRVFRVAVQFGGFLMVQDTAGIRNSELPDTDAWALGAFGHGNGYPKMGIFYQERLVLAGTRAQPQTVWMSQPASWHSFDTSIPAEDDDAVTFTLASKQMNEITGLASRADLLVFTTGGEWTVQAGSKSDVVTPSSITVTASGYRGSADIAPLDVGQSTLYVQRGGRTVRSLGYSLEVDGYTSGDLSILAEHLFRTSGVLRWAYQQEPWSIVWIVREDGGLLSLTIDQEQQVLGFARQTLSGPGGGTMAIEDVCCIPSANGRQDDVYFLARAADDARYILRLGRADEGVYVDGGVFRWGYTSVVECMEWEQQASLTLQGRHKHLPVTTFRVFETDGFRAGVMTETNGKLDLVSAPGTTPYTGDIRAVLPGGEARLGRLRIEHSSQAGVTILGVFPEVSVLGE